MHLLAPGGQEKIFKGDEMKRVIVCLAAVAVLLLGLSGIAMAYTIMDDATGGDCTQIGVWDAGTKTCKLTRDLEDAAFFSECLFHVFWTHSGACALNIDSDNITINGNGHAVRAEGIGGVNSGVFLSGRTEVTVTDLNIIGFWSGIFVHESSSNNIISNNSVSSSVVEIYSLWWSYNNIINANFIDNCDHGITLWYAGNAILSQNTLFNSRFGISDVPPEKCATCN